MMSGVTKRLYIKVANEIIEQIKNKQYELGDCIPPERKLAEQLGVSRTVVREAMVYLEMVGIADIRKGSGVFVIRSTPKMGIGVAPEVTPFEILEARLLIEPELAGRAAENNTPELIAELSQCIQMMESSVHFSEETLRQQTSVDADRKFHKAISSACNNPLLIKFYTELSSLHMEGDMWMRMDELANEPAARGQWVNDHKAIFNQIKKGDSEKAREVMYQHISNVINEIAT